MNLLKQFKHFFQRRKALRELFDDMENLDAISLEKRILIFAEVVTPKFAEIGLKNWNGKYLWFSDFNDAGIKHVVEYNVFKYFGGSFTYGNCYDFIPTLSADKLIYHRTPKSTKVIYYKKVDGWQKSDDEDSPVNIDHISTVNEEKFRKTLNEVLERNIPKLREWFENNQTIEQNIESLLTDLKKEKIGFVKRIISFDYILCFLFAQLKDFETAEKYLSNHLDRDVNTKAEADRIKEKIKSAGKSDNT
jgi:hypothetical protein